MDYRNGTIPKRLAILTRLSNLLKTITPENGYHHDLSEKVFRGRALFGDEVDMPAVTLVEAPTAGMARSADVEKMTNSHDWTIFVQGMVEDNKQNPTDAVYWLHADVLKCLTRVLAEDDMHRPLHAAHYRLGNLIDGITLSHAVCRPPEQGVSDKSFFWMPITVKYTLENSDPFYCRNGA